MRREESVWRFCRESDGKRSHSHGKLRGSVLAENELYNAECVYIGERKREGEEREGIGLAEKEPNTIQSESVSCVVYDYG